MVRRSFRCLTFTTAVFPFASALWAGSIFLTGHDPDFHGFVGGNALGAQHIIQRAVTFINLKTAVSR